MRAGDGGEAFARRSRGVQIVGRGPALPRDGLPDGTWGWLPVLSVNPSTPEFDTMPKIFRYRPSPARPLAFVVLGLLAAACASGGGAGGGGEATPAAGPGEIILQVHNTDSAGQPLRIYLVPEAGTERVIGNVAFNEVLTVPHTGGQGRFQFRAERPDGSTVTSPLFTAISGTYVWDIALRRVERKR